MRTTALVALLVLALGPALASPRQLVVASLGRTQAEPGAPDGRQPIDKPVGTGAHEEAQQPTGSVGDAMTPDDIKNAQMIAQLGAIGLLAMTWVFYRRDFWRKIDETKAEAERRLQEQKNEYERQLRVEAERASDLRDLVEQCRETTDKTNAAITAAAVTTARQTDATHRLARSAEKLERQLTVLDARSKAAAEEGSKS